MKQIKLIAGEICLFNNQIVIIKSLEPDFKQVRADFIRSGESKLLSIDELKPISTELAKKIVPEQGDVDLIAIDEKQLSKAEKKRQIIQIVEINAVRSVTPKGRQKTVKAIAQSYGCHAATIYRNIKKYNESGRELRSLLEKVKGGKGKNRLQPTLTSWPMT